MGAGGGEISKELTTRIFFQGVLALLILAFLLSISPAILLVAIIRLLVWFISKAYRPDLDGFVTGYSAVFSCWPDFNLVSCNFIDGIITTQEVRSSMKQKIFNKRDGHGRLLYRKCKQTWAYYGGFIFWKTDENFMLENHIRDYDYTGKLKISCNSTENDVRSIINGLIQLPWKEGRSPWEMLQISMTEKSAKPRTVVIFRNHHALLDGYSFSELMKDLFDLNIKYARPKTFTGKRIKVGDILNVPYDFAGLVIEHCIFRAEWYCPGDGNKRDLHTSAYASIPVGLVKEVNRKLRTSYIVALFSAVGGAIQRMFEEAELPIPEVLTTMTPIPRPNHPGGLTNHLILGCFKWPIKAASTAERVQKIQAQFSRLASSPTTGLIGLTPELIGLLPASTVSILANLLVRCSSTVASCFPVPEGQLHFNGKEVTSLHFELGIPGQNLGATILMAGVNGKQGIVMTMDKRIFPSVEIFQLFGEYIEEELQSLISR